MSSYTMTMADIVDDYTRGYPFNNVREKIEYARNQIFDFDYPFFDQSYKKIFETNIIRRFYMREIGFETDGLFKFQLETWLLIHMPYFNKLFESEMIKYDPLINSKLDVTHNKEKDKIQNDVRDAVQNTTNKETGNVNQTGKSDSVATNDSTGSQDKTSNEKSLVTDTGTKTDDDFNRKLTTDTPDARLGITAVDGQGVIEYASTIEENTINNAESTVNKADGTKNITSSTDNVENAKGTSNENTSMNGNSTVNGEGETIQNDKLKSTINDIEDFVQHRIGKVGSQTYAEMVMRYRESFLRIEQTIHKEMNQLFMLVY